MHASTWCLWRVSHHCMFFFHATVISEKSYPQKWWKQSMYDDLLLFIVNNELFLCYLHFAKVSLAWASIRGTWLSNCCLWFGRSVPQLLKFSNRIAGSPEKGVCAWHCSTWVCHFWVDNELCLTWVSINSWKASCCKYKAYFFIANY